MIERLNQIAEREIPILEKDCRIRRATKNDNRKILIAAMIRELHHLNEEQKEQKIKQWEDACKETNKEPAAAEN